MTNFSDSGTKTMKLNDQMNENKREALQDCCVAAQLIVPRNKRDIQV